MPLSATDAAARAFFRQKTFAVVGASTNPTKFGHQIFIWYLAHSLPAIPINPTTPTITAFSTPHSTLPSLSSLPAPKETAVSIITPPAITLKVLTEAKGLGVPAVWLQPGSWDEGVEKYLEEAEFEVVVGGEGGHGHGGWCVLVDGEKAAKAEAKL